MQAASTGIPGRIRVGVRVIRVVSWFDLALGVVLLGWVAFGEFSWNVFRGGMLLAVLGTYGLWFFRFRHREAR